MTYEQTKTGKWQELKMAKMGSRTTCKLAWGRLHVP